MKDITEFILNIECPLCKKPGIAYNTELYNIPNFKEVLITKMNCTNCNYKDSDVLITEQNKPVEHEFIFADVADLDVKVVRATSASIEIPELGVKIDPAYSGQSFITNIEGILNRVKSVLEMSGRSTRDIKKKKHVHKLLDKIARAKKGKFAMTIIIKDPLGNSFIDNKKVKTREYSINELEISEEI